MTSEVFNCDIDDVFKAIVNSKDRLAKLFSYFENRKPDLEPINSSHCQFLVRAISSLLQKYYKNVIQFILETQETKNIVQRYVVCCC